MRIQNLIFAACAALTTLSANHPADSNADQILSDQEFVAYAGSAPDANLLQQAENIWKHGGAYGESTVFGTTTYLPDPGGDAFVAMAAYSVAPFTLHEIDLPTPVGALTAHFYKTGDSSTYYPATLSEVGGNLVIALPQHPLTPDTGGTVYLEVTENLGQPDERLHPIGFVEIESLAPGSPGSLNALLVEMDGVIDHLESIRDIDFSNYFVGGPNYNGPFVDGAEALEVALVRILKDPKMDGGIQQVLQLTSGDDDYSVAFRAQLDRLYDYSDLTTVASLFPTQLTAPNSAQAAGDAIAAVASASAPYARAASGGGRNFAYKPAINTADALAHYMTEQVVAEQMLQDPVFSPSAGVANTVVGLAGAPGAVASGIYGTASSLLQMVYERRANTYPNEATLNASFTKNEFQQDECGIIGNWTCSATATSKGWDASAELIDLALNFAGAIDGAKEGIEFAQAAGKTSLAELTQDFNQEATKANISKVRDDGLKNLGDQIGLVTIPPDTWNVASLNPPYVEMTQIGGTLTIDGTTYYPNAIGSSSAYLRARSGQFPSGRVTQSDPQAISLSQAQLTLSGQPPNTYTPGQVYTITASAVNLATDDPSISWTADGGNLGTPIDLGNGQSQVDWTAPSPAATDPVTITATLDKILCHPPDAPTLTTSAVTSGGRYRLSASPAKGCYDAGETILLAFEDLDDPNNSPQTDFSLSGPGTLFKNGPNTATLTYDGAGSVGVIAELSSDSGKFEMADFIYGCVDLEPTITANPDAPDQLFLSFGELTLFVLGSISTANDELVAEFTAQTHYDAQYALYLIDLAEYNADPDIVSEPEPPVFGEIGVDTSGAVHSDPSFAFEVAMPYTTESCGPVVPGFVDICYVESERESTLVRTVGIAGDYTVDSLRSARSSRVDFPGAPTNFTIYLVPEN